MKILFLKDSSDRRKQFALTTRICIDNGKKVVIKEPCFPEGIPHIKRIVESQRLFAQYYQNVEINKTWIENDMLYAEFIDGVPLSDFYIKAIQNNDKNEIIKLIKYHLKLSLGRNNACTFKPTGDFVNLFGETEIFKGKQALVFTFFDPLHTNIIFRNGDINRPCFIDYEWFFDFPVPVSIIKFRIVQLLSMLAGIDDIIPLKERLAITGCRLSFNDGIIFLNKFSYFVYKENSIIYSFLNKNFEKTILHYPDIVTYFGTVYFDTGNGYSEKGKLAYFFARNEVEISCQIPENTIAVRLDPVEGYGCVISNLEILSYGGIVKYEPINGFMDKAGDMVFTNTDPQIKLHGASYWLKIKYRVLFLSEFSHYRVLNDYIVTIGERDGLVAERDGLVNSRSWRFTRPLRKFTAFIRRNKVLYLFARGLLSIKRAVSYNKREQLPSFETDGFFYESEYQKNMDFSGYEPRVKAIAFYLPQFHRIPENDKWWGEGFTEWTNTRKAKPVFKGHYQPRKPHKDIRYYDLTNIETIKRQTALAKQHGIYGFCFYLYWFSGKRLLEKPLNLFLEHPEIDINFCLCWANENWTRRWDGLDNEILIKQNYSEDDPYRFIEDIKKYFVDKRYIRVDGIPVILVYNPGNIPNIKDVFIKWKKHANEIGIGQIKIWICKTFGHTPQTLHIEDTVDGTVEFPPHGIPLPTMGAKDINLAEKTGNIYDYRELVSEIKKEFKFSGKENSKFDITPLYRTCMAGWDNSARKRTGWSIFAGFSLKCFFEWTSLLVAETIKTKKPFLFVNAWNEWAEGTYLEPDKKYGYANINTLSKAICGLPFDNKNSIGQKIIKKLNKEFIKNDKIKIGVQIHLYYLDLIDEIIMNLNFIPFPFCCYISTDTDEKVNIIQNEFNNRCKNAHNVYVKRFINRGRDVAPFIEQMENEINKYEFILHIHSKKSRVDDEYRDDWRKYLFRHLLGSTENIYRIFEGFLTNKKLGLIFPETFSPVLSWMVWGTDMQQGKRNVQDFLKKIGAEIALGEKPEFAAGDMFWARTKSIRKAFDAGITQNDFPIESGQEDMTLAHTIERSWVYIAQHEGYNFKQISNVSLENY